MDALTRIETKPGPWVITDPNWPKYEEFEYNPIYTSDTFTTGVSDIPGRISDASVGGRKGGTPMPWLASSEDRFFVEDGALTGVAGGGLSTVGISHELRNLEVSMTIKTFPYDVPDNSGDSLWVEAWREGAANSSGQSTYRVVLRPDSRTYILQKRISGSGLGNQYISASIPANEGDSISLRLIDNTFTFILNGEVAATADLSEDDLDRTIPAFSGFSINTVTQNFEIQEYVIRTIDRPEDFIPH